MQRNRRWFCLSMLALACAPAATWAQVGASWNGVWSGRTADGRAVRIVIFGGQVQSFQIDEQSFPVGVSELEGDFVRFSPVSSSVIVSMEREGLATAVWTMADLQGETLAAVLVKDAVRPIDETAANPAKSSR